MDSRNAGLGRFVIRHRALVGLLLLAVTGFAAFWAARVRIATNFVALFPNDHPYVRLYERYLRYGSAERVIFVVHVKHGDIFNYATLKKIQGIQFDTNRLPRINHDMVFSLASYLTAYTVDVPGGIDWQTYMFPEVPKTPAEIEHLRNLVRSHQSELRNLVSPDFKSAAIVGTLIQGGSEDYTKLFDDIQAIVHRYQDANNVIYVTGEPVIRGYGYYYFHTIELIFFVSIALMLLALYLCLGNSSSWWVPAVTGTFSAMWGLGFVGWRGYDFDPLMLVVPFLLTARDISHGVQWQRRYNYLMQELDNVEEACIRTTNYMFPAGVLAILADVAGIIFISFSGIPILDDIARAGTVWLAASLTMVFIFQPILMSYLPKPRYRAERIPAARGLAKRAAEFGNRLARFGTQPGIGRIAMMLGALAFLIWGVAAGLRAEVGYFQPGTPLYKPTAKVNRDLAAIEKNFPTDEGWVIPVAPGHFHALVPTAKSQLTIMSLPVLRMEDALHDYLLQSSTVRDVQTLADQVVEPSQAMLYDGHPKFVGLPTDPHIATYSIMMFMHNRANGTMDQYFLHNTACLRVLLTDHTAKTLSSLVHRLALFNRTYIAQHPALKGLKFEYLGGIAGLYAAANDVLLKLDFTNIIFVLVCVFVFCTVSFRSFAAGVLFVLACVLANFGAFIYLRLKEIGLTIDTVPVISLGIGLGVDYGIYTVARIRDEVMGGMKLTDAAVLAKRNTGATVLMVLIIMAAALVPWMFSPALFHTNMSLMLAMLMFLNMIAGVMVLPAFVTWLRLRFVAGEEQTSEIATATVNEHHGL